MNKKLLLPVAAAGFVLSGCAVRTTARVPQISTPAGYSAAEHDPSMRAEAADLKEWWTSFNDSTLDSLVERAIRGNIDLRIAQERVREARATRGYTAATRRLPDLGMSGGYSDRSSSNQNFASGGNGLFQTGFDASYELDFFGGARASVSAAEADALAAEEAARASQVTVVSEVARSYMELRQLQERLELARKSLESQKEILRLTELRRQAGLTTELDVARATAQVETTTAAIPSLEAQASRAMTAIAVLLGEQPGALEAELSKPGEIPGSPPEVPVGLPSDLLRRRPDIRQAERQIQGAAARVGVAVSNLYPKFALTSGTGGQSNSLLNLLSGAASLWNFGSSFQWGLLNYPATKANINAAESREQQQMATYEKTVLTALKDVEDALTNYTRNKERQASLRGAAAQNRKALELATQRYTSGLTSFLDVLDAQRSLYASEDAVTQSRGAIATDLISIYKALGGGW
jgi:NodT family efflux transporter outer membrane factor (OMF) lipoprotein